MNRGYTFPTKKKEKVITNDSEKKFLSNPLRFGVMFFKTYKFEKKY